MAPSTTSAEGDEEEADVRDVTAVLRYPGPNPPSRMDPHRSTLSQDNDKHFLVYDRLVHQAPNGDPIPGLALSWAFVEDGTVLRFELGKGVKFHDGEMFDAAAVKANIERAKTVEGGTQAGDLNVVTEVVIVDDFTVDLLLDGPAASLPLILSDRAGAMMSPAAFDNADLDEIGVGAGMYRIVSHNVGSLIVMEAFEDYWDPEARPLAGFEYHILPDPNQPLNRARTPLADVKVRQAINHAIDREAMVNALLRGYVAFNEEIGCDDYEYNPEKAKQLLTDAGYPDGFELELLNTPPGGTPRTEAVVAYLEAIGIKVTVRDLAPGTAGDIWLAQRQGDMLTGTWGGRPDALEEILLKVNDQRLSPEERGVALREATRIVVEEAIDVPLYQPSLPNVWNSRVVGAEAYLSGEQEFRFVYMRP